jgi:hypothetical protein
MNRISKVQAAAKNAPTNKNKNTAQKKTPPRAPANKKKQTSAAAAYATGQSSGVAQIYRNSVDSCRIRHRELLASITGSTAFAVPFTFALNPGIAATAPWLALEAQGWEKYEFNSLKLCYYTRTGSSIPGSVILAPDYDAADAAPVSEQIASAYYGTEEDAPWKDIKLNFDKEELKGKRYVRTSALGPNLDIKTYDVGNAFVCTTDGTAVNWGKVWLEYDITLFNPQLPPGGAAGSGTLQGAGGSFTAATPFGAVPISLGSYALAAAATNVISMSGLPVGGEIAINIVVGGTVFTQNLTPTALTGITLKTQLSSAISASTSVVQYSATYTVNTPSATITVGNLASTTVTSSEIILCVLTPSPGF